MLGNLVVGLGLNSRGFSRGLDQSQSRLGGFANFVRGGIAGVVVAIGAMAASATAGLGISLVASAEQAEVAFTTMLGSAEQAKSMLGEIESFAASTPFQLQGLKESAQQLLAFGVAGGDVMPLMKTLGDLAAGTQKPIADFVDIFGKVKASGIAALGDVNRLADRGVPIYQALAKVMGKPQSSIRKLASTGKIGLGEIRAALESVVQEGGLFENAMQKQSQTLAGVWSTAKDNVLFIVQDLFTALLAGFDLKGSLSGAIGFIQSFRESIRSALPFVTQIGRVVKANVGTWLEMAGMVKDSFVSAFSFILGHTGTSFTGMRDFAMGYFVALEFGYKNWQKIAGLAITGVMLKTVSFFGQMSHFFTGVIPALLTGFADNWGSTFNTAADFVMTVFINIGQNIRNIMSSIWDFIASGGKKSLSLAWTPLTEGFHNSMKEIKIPDRLKSDFEKELEQQFSSLKLEIGTDFNTLLKERMKAFDPPAKKQAEKTSKLKPTTEDSLGAEPGKIKSSFGAALKGSRDAVSSIIRNVNQTTQKVEEKILTEAKKQTKKMDQQKKTTEKTNQILAANAGNTQFVGVPVGP